MKLNHLPEKFLKKNLSKIQGLQVKNQIIDVHQSENSIGYCKIETGLFDIFTGLPSNSFIT